MSTSWKRARNNIDRRSARSHNKQALHRALKSEDFDAGRVDHVHKDRWKGSYRQYTKGF